MFDVSVEQIIKTKAPKSATAYKTVMVIACIVAVTTIPSTAAFGVLLAAMLIVFTVVLFKYFNAEYEYSLTDGDLTIDKIMSQSMRKRCGVYNIARAELITNVGSQDALRMEYKQLRTSDYSANDGGEGVVVIYSYNSDNEMERIFIQPNERMLEALSSAAPKGAYKVEHIKKDVESETTDTDN